MNFAEISVRVGEPSTCSSVETVSQCDVDCQMLEGAAKIVAERQESGKGPRSDGDYRKMLEAGDLDLVLKATLDHRHAMPMIAAVEAGAEVYVQKPLRPYKAPWNRPKPEDHA